MKNIKNSTKLQFQKEKELFHSNKTTFVYFKTIRKNPIKPRKVLNSK